MDSIQEVLKDYQKNYKDHFHHSLMSARIGLIVIFILITLVYQAKYRKIENAQTFFGHPSTRIRIVGGALVAAVLGMMSVVFVIVSRAGTGAIMRNINKVLVVGVILFLFTVAQESSGFNRWLSRKETAEGKGPYAYISKEKYTSNNHSEDYEKDLEDEKKCETKHQPFLDSVSTLSLILIGIGLVYFIGRMLLSTYYGFTSGQNNLDSLPGMFGGTLSPLFGFALELIIVGGLNAISPVVDPIIRGEGYDSSKAIMIFCIFIISVSLHVMLQYTGMLKAF
jgi:hypothetical protein